MDMMGRSFTGIDKKMNPNLSTTEIKMGALTVMKSTFDGSIGYQMQMGKKTDMEEAEIKEAKDDLGVIPQLYYNGAAYITEYVGSGKVEEEETYRLKVVMPSGRTSVQQYSIKSGLLIQEETTSKQGAEDVPLTILYKNYKKVGSVLLPFEITRNMGGQEFTIVITDIKLNEGVKSEDFK
jgi:hypothetical protein